MTDRPTPVRLQLSRKRGFDLQALSLATNGLPAVNCARPGSLGNPFVVGRDGDRARCVELHKMLLGGLVCVTREPSFEDQIAHRDYVAGHLDELRGRNIACWCQGTPCHADLLLELANAPIDSPQEG